MCYQAKPNPNRKMRNLFFVNSQTGSNSSNNHTVSIKLHARTGKSHSYKIRTFNMNHLCHCHCHQHQLQQQQPHYHHRIDGGTLPYCPWDHRQSILLSRFLLLVVFVIGIDFFSSSLDQALLSSFLFTFSLSLFSPFLPHFSSDVGFAGSFV